MARKSNTRAAAGAGSIRQRPDGRWEARYSYEDELGVKKRSSIYADTQKECKRKLTAILKSIDDGVFTGPAPRVTLKSWTETWLDVYCRDLKPSTMTGYRSKISKWIVPRLGDVQLTALTPARLQRFVNSLSDTEPPISAKTVKNISGILHKILAKAVVEGLITRNPADGLKLPEVQKAELSPLMDDDLRRFLDAIRGDDYERLFYVALFTGMRQSELLGLKWSDLDLDGMTARVRHQLQRDNSGGPGNDGQGYFFLDSPKNRKPRTITLTPSVVRVLKSQRAQQNEWRLAAGSAWNNEHDLVFTDSSGEHLKHRTIQNHFKRAVTSIGKPEVRFHDLRHSYAVAALQAGDNVKNVQEQLGHYSSAFTMDTYADVSETMRQDSRNKMEALIKSVSDL